MQLPHLLGYLEHVHYRLLLWYHRQLDNNWNSPLLNTSQVFQYSMPQRHTFCIDRVVIYAVYYCIGPQTEMLDNGSNTSSDAVFVCVCVCVLDYNGIMVWSFAECVQLCTAKQWAERVAYVLEQWAERVAYVLELHYVSINIYGRWLSFLVTWQVLWVHNYVLLYERMRLIIYFYIIRALY